RALRGVSGRLPPWARPPESERLAGLGLRPLGARVEPWLPAIPRRAGRRRRVDRGSRRGRALLAVPAPARPGLAVGHPRATGPSLAFAGMAAPGGTGPIGPFPAGIDDPD